MLRMIGKAIAVTLMITLIAGALGFIYGKLVLANEGVDWWLPDNLVDKENYIAVGSAHNFGYLGGLLGLIAGIIYQIHGKSKQESASSTVSDT